MSLVDWVGVGAVIVPTILWGYRMFALLKDIQADQKILKMDTLRLKFLTMVQQAPTEVAIILALFDEYKLNGGDSWVDDVFLKWKKQYGE